MMLFYKIMAVSACLFMVALIVITRKKSDDKGENLAQLLFDAYAVGLIFTAIKIFWG